MKVVIDGNGTRPLTEQVKELQDAKKAADLEKEESKKVVAAAKQEHKEYKTKWDTRTWALAVSIFLLFAGQVVQLIFK
jgi:hypothetical protein